MDTKSPFEKRLIAHLNQKIASGTPLEAAVAQTILDESDGDPPLYLEYLLQYGCRTGMVSSLVYHSDTFKFFHDYSDDINDIIDELQEDGIFQELPLRTPIENSLAWLAFEETAYRFYQECEGP